jgi:trimeric autotransporter adhesin
MYSVLSQFFRFNTSQAARLFRTGFILLAFVYFAPHQTLAVSPPPDGDYPGNNTAEGGGALFSLTSGINNTALGARALFTNNTGRFNTATGSVALERNQSGSVNTATGYNALFSNTTGSNNTATGANALFSNTGATENNRSAGSENTADGSGALFHNTAGNNNTAVGFEALFRNTGDQCTFCGTENTAVGSNALFSNTNGFFNTAVGYSALANNVGGLNGQIPLGSANTAIGWGALQQNTQGNDNTATGAGALQSHSFGDENVADGASALFSNTDGRFNTAVGFQALVNAQNDSNTAVGYQAGLNLKFGSENILLGGGAGSNLTTGSSNIDIGNAGVTGDSAKIRVGTQGAQTAAFIAGIYNVNEGGTIKPVYINSNGQLGTQPPASSARFKDKIKPMDNASEAIMALKPVTFHYKSDNQNTPQFGLIAEEVAKVNPDLVVRDDKGEIYTVRYDAVNAMLLNEFLKEHRKVEEQGAIIAKQQEQIDTLTAGFQKLTARLEATNSALRVVSDN